MLNLALIDHPFAELYADYQHIALSLSEVLWFEDIQHGDHESLVLVCEL